MTQSTIFLEDTVHTYHLEYHLREGADPDALKAALGALLAERVATPHLVIAFGPALWERLAPAHMPADLLPFAELRAPSGQVAAATQGDVFLWLHGPRYDEIFELALVLDRHLAPHLEVALEVPGFVYRDSRDLIGFIDGTANPKDDERLVEALVPAGQPGAGGSIVLTQKWVHDLPRFEALPLAEQEGVVGRTKTDSVELEGDAMPVDSHVSRTDVKVDGVGQKIYRCSTPFGTVREHGLYFLAFACAFGRLDIQLRRMYGLTEDGLHDRLIEFSTAVSGSYWFAPAESHLAETFAPA